MSATTTPVKAAQFGVVGLGVMGQNLALNIEDHGESVAVWNLEPEWVDRFVAQNTSRRIVGTKRLQDFVQSLARPRRILMMIKAGDPVDQMLGELAPFLASGDILIDGGNSYFKDTRRRESTMREQNLNFFGMGVSGGEEGTQYGPALMPGGDREAYEHMRPVLEAIAAKRLRPMCHLCRPRRRRTFRENGAQRHRVRRHAIDRGSLRSDAQSSGA